MSLFSLPRSMLRQTTSTTPFGRYRAALVDIGREREAVSIVLLALAPHLPRYQRSMANYARLLIQEET